MARRTTTITHRVIPLRYEKPGPKPRPREIRMRCVNIPLTLHWHEAGKKLAEERGVSFSRYVELLIYTDSGCNESVE